LPVRPALTGVFALFGLALAFAGPSSPLLLVPVIGVWAAVLLRWLGTRTLVTASMMLVAFTAPMNGVRVGGVLALTDVLLFMAVLGLALEASIGRRRWHPLPAAFTFGTALVIAGGLLGTLFADRPVASLASLLPFTLAATVPVIAVRMWSPSFATLRRYAWCWIAGAAVSGIVGLLSTGGVTGRPDGLTTHPNHLAMSCALGAGLAVALMLSEQGGRRHAALAVAALLTLTVVRAGSRAALLALLLSTAVIFLRTRDLRPARARIGRGALAVLGLSVLAGALLETGVVRVGQQNAVQRLLGDASARASDAGRFSVLEQNVGRIADRPLTGSGFEDARQAHNIYVQVWASAGAPGLVGFVMLVVAVVRRGARSGRGPLGRYLSTAFLAGYLGYLLAGLAQNILWDRYVWLHLAVVLWAGEAIRIEEAEVATPAATEPVVTP
jgi:O-antigen ligase